MKSFGSVLPGLDIVSAGYWAPLHFIPANRAARPEPDPRRAASLDARSSG
jgi:hypothetical protein